VWVWGCSLLTLLCPFLSTLLQSTPTPLHLPVCIQTKLYPNQTKRRRVRAHLVNLLASDGILALPSAPGPAPLIGLPGPQLDDWRRRVMSLTCVAGLGGLPQVSLPVAGVRGLPVGLSLVGGPGSDEGLLEIAERVQRALGGARE